MRRFGLLLAAVFVIALFTACRSDDAPGTTACPTETPAGWFGYAPTVTFGDVPLFVEIADDGTERGRGLMNQACLGDDWGMLFVYPEDAQNTFWMKDTLVPLSIAWTKADGTILEIEDMQPQTEESHSAPEPYRYAIEANQGWFTDHGIEAGDRATIPPNLSAS